MIERYTRPAMGRIWEPENKFRTWLRVEILSCEAWADLGVIPRQALEAIKERADFDIERIDQLESHLHHDVLAFTTCVAERVGEAGRFFHYGLTSSDVVDTALSALLREAATLLIEGVDPVIEELALLARRHRDTIMVGRTHGIHAEPMTFGLKMALWHQEMLRNRDRLVRARDVISVGKLSGAVGTYAQVDPRVEEYVCHSLGLTPAPLSTQIIQRDRHAEFMSVLALVGASLEKFTTEIRSLQKTEVGEVLEPFGRGQKGSSAMPHKRNPILCERISGLARVLRSYASTAMENVALWHERDISHSSTERVILPDATILLDYMLDRFLFVLQGLEVREGRMIENLHSTRGLIHSGTVLLALTRAGMSREEAYSRVQGAAMDCWQGGSQLFDLLKQDEQVLARLGEQGLRACFDEQRYLARIPEIYERLGLDGGSDRGGDA